MFLCESLKRFSEKFKLRGKKIDSARSLLDSICRYPTVVSHHHFYLGHIFIHESLLCIVQIRIGTKLLTEVTLCHIRVFKQIGDFLKPLLLCQPGRLHIEVIVALIDCCCIANLIIRNHIHQLADVVSSHLLLVSTPQIFHACVLKQIIIFIQEVEIALLIRHRNIDRVHKGQRCLRESVI